MTLFSMCSVVLPTAAEVSGTIHWSAFQGVTVVSTLQSSWFDYIVKMLARFGIY